MKMRHIATMGAVSALALGSAAAAQTEIQWWHAMGGELGVATEAVATAFNATQSDYVVVPTYRGTYTETLNRRGSRPSARANSPTSCRSSRSAPEP